MGGRNGSGIGGGARCREGACAGASRHGNAGVPLIVASMPRQAGGHSHSPPAQNADAASPQHPAIAAECGAVQGSAVDAAVSGNDASANAGAFSTRATSSIHRSSRPGRFTRE
ncbi:MULTISPECIES: hypothetical protein [Stenotrophomonas]|uniref:hypothetical protein n=1 Tax=Stenotrophomonas TaxID=40323 RepID=UPI00289E37C5|nr:hypothetical protein [Stenotrophomonas sp.]